MTNFMTFYDVLCQWNKETEIVIKCRKVIVTKMSEIVVTFVANCRDGFSVAVPFPPSPFFGFRRWNPLHARAVTEPNLGQPRKKHSVVNLQMFKEEGRGTRNGYEASKGSKGISGL